MATAAAGNAQVTKRAASMFHGGPGFFGFLMIGSAVFLEE